MNELDENLALLSRKVDAHIERALILRGNFGAEDSAEAQFEKALSRPAFAFPQVPEPLVEPPIKKEWPFPAIANSASPTSNFDERPPVAHSEVVHEFVGGGAITIEPGRELEAPETVSSAHTNLGPVKTGFLAKVRNLIGHYFS